MTEEVQVEVELITPELAREYLKYNTSNRPIRANRVNEFIDKIKNGGWLLTNQGIGFNIEGGLVDGQHRLIAVAEAGRSVHMQVSRNLAIEARDVVDTGTRRTIGDVLAMDGMSDPNKRGAAARLLWRYRNDCWRKDAPVSHPEIKELLANEPGLLDALPDARKAHKEIGLTESVGAVAFYLTRNSGIACEEWIEGVVHGVGVVTEGSPSRQFRRQVINHHTRDKKLTQRRALGLYARAWVAWVRGKEVQLLRFHEEDSILDIENPRKKPKRPRK